GTAENGSSVQLFVDGVGDSTGSASPYSITASPLLDGSFSLTAKATDTAGNTSVASGSLSVTIDTSAPAAPATPDPEASSDTGSSSTDNITGDDTPTFNGTAEAGSFVELLRDGSSVGSSTADGFGAWTITDTPSVADGTYNYRARATDTAGNVGVSDPLQVLVVEIDTAAPAAPSTPDLATASDSGASSSDNVTSDSTPSFGGSAEPNSTVDLYAGATRAGSGSADGSGNWSITSSLLAHPLLAHLQPARRRHPRDHGEGPPRRPPHLPSAARARGHDRHGRPGGALDARPDHGQRQRRLEQRRHHQRLDAELRRHGRE